MKAWWLAYTARRPARRFNDALADALAWSIKTGAIIGAFIALLVLGLIGTVYLLTHIDSGPRPFPDTDR